ncbi:MAG: hypothetical protein COV34_03590 [Candidatus Zambryskibacteria bacterium CG10_big_fil_rev_8_21_14_0_10_42_12]|uniref:Uncharacterized protein n=1 Tax=Candidatus Zambryskibacteria bacterium CG10_big_fil_rev_8_21_14_0_10_42_12 TaxID=1975115 RepID=A0A2H0QSN5_9BACT|nr:MAG: hypothetical protein COV34_03590 [Candidatus Zambryskibacteria bacterium CG10_big_fil_rev_8_21_14_0_10_42_12]
MDQEQHKKFYFLKVVSLIVIVIVLIFLGIKFNADTVTPEDCEFPQTATDLRAAGQKLSEEISGTVGYSADGKITVDSANGFVLLTPVADEGDIITKLREQITATLGCDGTTNLAYWVFNVSDPEQLPPEILDQLGTERPDQILVILGSLYVFSVNSLVTDPDSVDRAVTRIVTDRGGAQNSTGNATFSNNQTPGSNVDFGTTPAPAPLEKTPETGTGGFGTSVGGGSTGGGTSGGGSTGGSTGGSGSSGSGSQCTLKVVCEDPGTGAQYTPGASGCQGSDFYSQTPPPPEGTRQIALCVYGNGTLDPTGTGCPDEYWFYYRNCVAEANNLDLAGQDAVTTPEDYDAIAGTLPANSPSDPGTLFTVPPTYPNSPVNYTVRCSYPDQTRAIQCGMPGSGEYCLPGYNPVGCVAPAADF